MRIAYVTQTRFPTEKAHGYQVAQVCDALAKLGHEVTLAAPTIGSAIKDRTQAFYGMPDSFRVLHLRQFDALSAWFIPGRLAFAVSMASYRRQLRRHFATSKPDLFYVRSAAVLPALLPFDVPVILELHDLPTFGQASFVEQCKRCALVACLTTPMRDALVEMGVDRKKVIVAPDGVSVERFATLPNPAAAAKQWKLPHGKTTVGYVGSLATRDTLEKGVGELVDAIAELKKRGEHAVYGWIVGGPKEWAKRYADRAKALGLTSDDIGFHDAIPAASVPSALAACDVCVYPAPASDHPFFLRDTSPLKLLEYLAAGRPVVCADLPPLHDLVDDDCVWFCAPGDASALADGIAQLIEFPADAMRRAEKGRSVAANHSWTKRMERILAVLGKKR